MLLSRSNRAVLKSMLLFLILSLTGIVVNGQQIVKSYGIGFYHGNTSLPASYCNLSFDKVRSSVYPTYIEESFLDSMFNTTIRDKIKSMMNVMSSRIPQRNLLRSSSTKREQDQNAEHDEERSLSTERQLQSWCYAQCTVRSPLWLITVGCRSECGLRRRLDGSIITSSEEEESNVQDQDSNDRELQSLLSIQRGNKDSILQGTPGDSTVKQFYALVNTILDPTDICIPVLLDITYAIWPIFMIV